MVIPVILDAIQLILYYFIEGELEALYMDRVTIIISVSVPQALEVVAPPANRAFL